MLNSVGPQRGPEAVAKVFFGNSPPRRRRRHSLPPLSAEVGVPSRVKRVCHQFGGRNAAPFFYIRQNQHHMAAIKSVKNSGAGGNAKRSGVPVLWGRPFRTASPTPPPGGRGLPPAPPGYLGRCGPLARRTPCSGNMATRDRPGIILIFR